MEKHGIVKKEVLNEPNLTWDLSKQIDPIPESSFSLDNMALG